GDSVCKLSVADVPFENYISTDLHSETAFLKDQYVLFLNDRLLDLSTFMADLLANDLMLPGSTAGTFRFASTEADDQGLGRRANIRLAALARHYYRDCP